ncbi:flagellar export protein FliJ [Chitinivorax sp. B]|uniref:flagellar export protein FliJ n=1 Tax=Chitinivorax sp. B TaxID=2502235 RepID=UPI0010F4EED7|nr:flagellar export protein FliJ [Chitinivorax sp. B]
MARPFQFQLLLDQAVRQSEDASRVMMTCRADWLNAEQKLQQLEGFRQEYRLRLCHTEQSGISVNQWRDYQAFIAKIDVAIRQQQEAINFAKTCFEQARDRWQTLENQVGAYRKLETRHHHQEQHRELKREQKMNDEFSARASGQAAARHDDIDMS